MFTSRLRRFALCSVFSAGLLGAELRAADVEPGSGRLELRTGVVETGAAENLLAAEGVSVRPEERLVLQLDGPMTPARRAAIEAAGVELGQYLPDNAYIVRLDAAAVVQLGSLEFVSWLGRYDYSWKIDPELGVRPLGERRQRLLAAGRHQVVVCLFDHAATDGVVEDLQSSGATVIDAEDVGGQWLIDAIVTFADVQTLALRDDVQFIEEAPDGQKRNDTNRWILQSNVSAQTPVWDHGLHGEGQMGGLIDGTIKESHCMFDDSVAIGPSHRKIVAQRNASTVDSHGTHTAGTFAGDSGTHGAYDTNDGMAYAAKLSASEVDAVYASPSTLNARFTDAHNDGARVHSNSWGDDGTTAYTTWCRQIDNFSYVSEESMVAFAVSNGSIATTPENAMSVLGVGASQDTPSQASHCSGGTGPTADGRRKPEIYAPGCNTQSANSSSTCGVIGFTGTSMACPAISGAGLLARQYFTSGFYPTGTAVPGNALIPTGALLRAVLVNGAVDMTGISGYPSNSEGWGRLLLDNALYFPGDAGKLYVQDVRNAQGLATGQTRTYQFSVNSAATPLKITMAYTQPPAAVNAANPVINNVDLEVSNPSAVFYRGNVFTSGQSSAGGTADPRNSIERVILNTPPVGLYTVTIRGTAVNQGTQGFALVVNGDITPGCAPLVGDVNDDCHVDLTDLSLLLGSFGACSGDPAFVAGADFDSSGCVDLADLAQLLSNFGA